MKFNIRYRFILILGTYYKQGRTWDLKPNMLINYSIKYDNVECV